MATIELRTNHSCTYVGVPNIFIDNYMADANGEFVKVYLYLLRCMNTNGNSVSISAIADHFNNTEKDVMRALKYWEKAGVLSLESDSSNRLTGVCLNDLNAYAASGPDAVPAQTPAKAPAAPDKTILAAADNTVYAKPSTAKTKPEGKRREYSLDEVKAFCNNHEVSELLFIIETYLKHPLNSAEMNTIFFWYDTLHFSGELIEYLVEYCITNGHSSLRYMDKVALGWSDNGIHTIDKAKEHISIHSKTYFSIMKAFGISGRNLADSEMTFVHKWTKEYHFDTELIQEACKRTISATQKPSFEYADSILTNWYNNKVHTLNDVTALDENYNKTKRSTAGTSSSAAAKKNKFNNFNQRAYNPDALEKVLLTTSV